MAVKEVSVNLINHPLSREEAGVAFNVKSGTAKFGELVVSKGGIRWKSRGKRDHQFMSWETLNRLMYEK
jgi:hypothetical protein